MDKPDRRYRPNNLLDLAAAVTESLLLAAAGERAFARGVAYFEAGAVTGLVVTDGTINARVEGDAEYAVQLWAESGSLGWSCTCPVGDQGDCCKHVVAAGLAWLARRSATPVVDDDLAAIRDWLGHATHEQLVELLLEEALESTALRRRLEARTARAAAAHGADIKMLKETVRMAFAVSGFVDYRGMRRLLERAWPTVELIAGLIEDGQATIAPELAGYALARGITAYTRIDDSAGNFGDLLHDLAALNLKACQAAPPKPTALARQLFDLLLRDEWGLVRFEDYRPLLGDAGLRSFRALAEKQWKKVPAYGPGEKQSHHATEHFQITRIMEALARGDGDVDRLVEIKGRDLTSPYQFLTIAELLADAGRHDEALDWAERGQAAFPERTDPRLVEYLTREYMRRDRPDEAAALAWEQWTERPALATYQLLKGTTEPTGGWTTWRGKALTWLREDYLKHRKPNRWAWTPGGHSLLVELFLWEGDSDAALAEAGSGGCTEALWFRLARAREQDHPDDAVAIYQARIDGIVDRRNNPAYDEAAKVIGRVGELMQRVKRDREFDEWLDAVRVRHKAKRNFMQRLDDVTGTSNEAQ